MAWYATRWFGTRGLVVAWLGSSAVHTAVMMIQARDSAASVGIVEPVSFSWFLLALSVMLYGAIALSLYRQAANPAARFSLRVAGRAVLAMYGAILLSGMMMYLLFVAGRFPRGWSRDDI